MFQCRPQPRQRRCQHPPSQPPIQANRSGLKSPLPQLHGRPCLHQPPRSPTIRYRDNCQSPPPRSDSRLHGRRVPLFRSQRRASLRPRFSLRLTQLRHRNPNQLSYPPLIMGDALVSLFPHTTMRFLTQRRARRRRYHLRMAIWQTSCAVWGALRGQDV